MIRFFHWLASFVKRAIETSSRINEAREEAKQKLMHNVVEISPLQQIILRLIEVRDLYQEDSSSH